MFTGAHNKVRGSIAIVRVQVPGIRRQSPGTLLNWCRLHKTKKQTVTKSERRGDSESEPDCKHRTVTTPVECFV